MNRSVLLGSVLSCVAALVAASDLGAQAIDTVHVRLTPDGAEVTQRLLPEGASIGAFAIRFDDQELQVLEVVREGESLLDATLTPTAGAYALDVASGAPIRVRYALSGQTDRIPLFVAGGRAELTVARGVEAPYMVQIRGSAERLAAIDLRTSLPRFEANGSGVLEARLSSIPSLVRLSSTGAFTFTRIADLMALLLIGAGVIWAVMKLRAVARDAGTDQ